MEREYESLGLVGRFRPLHIGGASLLEACLNRADKVYIGIGSANGYDARNPFTVDETKEMLSLYLESQRIEPSRYSIVGIDDKYGAKLPDGTLAWVAQIKEKIGAVDAFVSGNEYVAELLSPHYKILDSMELTKEDGTFREINASTIRQMMVEDGPWQYLVPKTTYDYITKHKLNTRLKKEFGTEIKEASTAFGLTYEQEKARIVAKE